MIIEKTLFSFGGVKAEGRDVAEEGSAGLTMFAAGQSNVFCVATRPAAQNIVWTPVRQLLRMRVRTDDLFSARVLEP